MYELTTQLATLEPPPPHLQHLLAAAHGNQEAMNGFARVIAGVTSPAEYVQRRTSGASHRRPERRRILDRTCSRRAGATSGATPGHKRPDHSEQPRTPLALHMPSPPGPRGRRGCRHTVVHTPPADAAEPDIICRKERTL
jgi:hypothetical protein